MERGVKTTQDRRQGKAPPPKKASPSPSKGGDVPKSAHHIFGYFKLYAIRTSPPSEGLGEAFFRVGFLFIPRELF